MNNIPNTIKHIVIIIISVFIIIFTFLRCMWGFMISIVAYTNEQQYITEIELVDKLKSTIIEKYKSNLNNIKSQLIQAGVEIETITKIVKPHALAAAKDVKKGNTKTIGTHFQQILKEMQETPIINQLAKSLLILLIVITINTFVVLFLVFQGVHPLLIIPTVAIFVAPLTEEAGKYFSIKKKATGMYFLVFNFVEFTLYLAQLLGLGMSLSTIIISRLLAVMMHYITTMVQWKYIKKGKDKRGFITATIIHTLWNFFASLGNILKHYSLYHT